MNLIFIGSSREKPEHFEAARRLGCRIAVLCSDKTKVDMSVVDDAIEADLFDAYDVLEKLEDYDKRHRISGCLTRFEPYVPLVGIICEHFHLSGPSAASVMNARDKFLMREAFAKAGIPQPKYMKVSSLDELKAAAEYLGYPFLLKPVSGAKSRYIQKIRSQQDLEPVFMSVHKLCSTNEGTLFRNYSDSQNDFRTTFIAEELIKGKQVTTTSLIAGGKAYHVAIADLVTGQDIGVDAFYLISRNTPSMLPEDLQQDICSLSTKAIKALGLDDTAVHPEFILTADGPKVIEISARIGGYRTIMTELAFGVRLDEAAVRIALGLEPGLEKGSNRAACAVEVWPKSSGRIVQYKSLDSIRTMQGIASFTVKRNPGDLYDIPPKGEKPIVTFVVNADSPERSQEIADDILAKVLDSAELE